MRTIWIFALCFCITLVANAQEDQDAYYYHTPKSSTFSLGLGLPSTTQVAAEFIGILDQEATASPQFTLRYEYALNDRIGIGAYGGYYTGETGNISLPSIQLDSLLNDPGAIIDNLLGGGIGTTSTYRINVITVGVFVTYHLYRFEKLDTYTIVRGGYNNVSITENGASNNNFIGAQVPQFEYFAGGGARYYFNPHIAIYGEVGNSILSPIHVNFGLTWRL